MASDDSGRWRESPKWAVLTALGAGLSNGRPIEEMARVAPIRKAAIDCTARLAGILADGRPVSTDLASTATHRVIHAQEIHARRARRAATDERPGSDWTTGPTTTVLGGQEAQVGKREASQRIEPERNDDDNDAEDSRATAPPE